LWNDLQVAVQYVLIQGRCYWRRKVHFVITGGGWGGREFALYGLTKNVWLILVHSTMVPASIQINASFLRHFCT